MKSSLKQTKRILEVLALKRQLIEKTLAEINLKFSHIEKKLGELSRRSDSPRLDDDARISFAIAAQKWEVWREQERQTLHREQAELRVRARAAQKKLQVLIVQIETFEKKYRLSRKHNYMEIQAAQSRQRLEIWQAATPLTK